jgi:ClpP class serine protease
MGSKVQVFAKRRGIPFYTFAEDLAASGGYWLLCSGTHGVYAHRNSLVGSIGVVSMMANFRN